MKRFKNILCVVEPGETCKPTLARAVMLAKNNQARLTVVDVVECGMGCIGMPEGSPVPAELQAALMKERAQELEALVEPYLNQIQIESYLLEGLPFLEIIREVLRHDRDLVIKAPEHRSWVEKLFGSDDMHLLRKCPCPVWLIKHHAPKIHSHILAAVDVDDEYPQKEQESRSALNRQILEMASSLALSDFAELHIAHAWAAVGESAMRGAFMRAPEDEIKEYVEQVRRQHQDGLDGLIREVSSSLGKDSLGYLKPQTYLLKGAARKEIPALAKRVEADLVVMGTVGRTGIPGFIMGNTAETILYQIDCSVLAIKPPGFKTPVTLEG